MRIIAVENSLLVLGVFLERLCPLFFVFVAHES